MKKWTNTNTKRRLLSLALSIVMVLSLLPAGALAEEETPVCNCTEVCAETVNESCQVCSTEVGQCTAAQQQEPVQQESEQEQKTETCTHGNDPETCEACASAKKVAQVQAQIDALPEDVTAESKEAAQSALSAVDTAKADLTAEQLAQLDMTRYAALTQKLAALESPAPSATEKTTEKTAKVITAWEWDDGYEIVDEKSGYVVLPFTSEDFTSQLDDVKGMLPGAILVDGETLPLETWVYASGEAGATVIIDSESCPSPGIFKTTLPEGYVLADGTNVLSLTVALSAGSSEDTSSYANSDTLTNVSYYDADGTLKTCPSATKVTSYTDDDGGNVTWSSGWYVVDGDVQIGNLIIEGTPPNQTTKYVRKTIFVQDDVHLILREGCDLFLVGQIEVLQGNSLTIYCDNTSNSGELRPWYSDYNHACIGGSQDNPNSGKITINGGYVRVSGGQSPCASIGSGPSGSAEDITINGGKIGMNSGGRGGAGLGTGKGGTSVNITINDGSISGNSGGGAFIGSGQDGAANGNVTVNIHGGKIDAYGRNGAIIGSGNDSQSNVIVNITGGNINTSTGNNGDGHHGAAIGGGYGATNTTVNIGGTAEVDAHGGENAPGIGSINPDGCSVTISGGTVKAWGGTYGAGIGGAHERNSCPVTIAGGTVTAYGGNTGAGIGSGCGGNSTTDRYTTGNIKISGGTVTANGGYFAAGIGGGEYNTAGDILISGGTVIAKRDASKDSGTMNPAKDVGDGATNSNEDRAKVYARYTLDGSAKLYLQNGYKEPSVQDAIRPKISSGYIFSGTPETYTAIRVYGSQTLSENFCIETGKTMTVMSDASLNTGSNKLYVKGTLTKDGTVNGSIYYPLTLVNCTAGSSNTSTYSGELFGKANTSISLTPALQSGYKLDKWTVTPNTVTVSGNSFTMPNQKTTVEAKGTQAVTITQQPVGDTITYGKNVSLEIKASTSISGGVISYQWYKDTEKLPNETSKTLPLRYLDASTQPYSFYCEVTCDGITVKSDTVTVTVEKAQASVTIDSDPGKPYDGKPVATPGFSASGEGFPKIEYKLQSEPDTAYTETPPMDAGEYTVRATMLETQNFKEASATKNFTILQATDNAWQTEPSVTNFTYGDTATNPVKYQALYGDDDVVVTYKKQGTEGDPSTTVPSAAGIYDVTVSLADTASYPGLPDVNLTLTIAKAASSVTTAPTDAQSLYNGNPVPLVAEGTANGGTMQYSLDGQNWSNDIPKATDWKTYTVYYKVAGDNNHNDTTAQTLTAEIVPFKIDGQPAKVTTSYGDSPWMYVDLKTQLSEQISYQWYQVTGSEGDVELSGETANKLTIDKPNAGTYSYICKITCGDYFKYSDPITVTVNPAQVENVGLSGYWAEGGEREIAPNETVTLTNPSSRLLTKYTTTTNDQGGEYPTGMQVFKLDENNQPVEITELGNLLQYSGCSIRINGKPGIRMITSLTKEAKELLKKGELAGYTLEEYGTVVAWRKELGDKPLTLSTGKSNYAYRKGVSDPVFANVGDLTQYTNVLVWDELDAGQYAADIAMRPYIILSKDGEAVTLYGGTVSRSIGYVAQQNANIFPKGSAGYNYVHDIIDKVNALKPSTDTTTGGNEE